MSPGRSSNESKSEAEIAIATVATLSQNLFDSEAPRDEKGTSTSSSKTNSRYQHLTKELGLLLDERTSAAGLDKHSPFTAIPFVQSEGFLTKMFGRQGAAFYIESLLKVDAKGVYLYKNVPGWPNALMSSSLSTQDAPYAALTPINGPLWLLDFVPVATYNVIPQKIWTPPNQSDWRRYVEQASLRMPIFFIQNNGTTGLPLVRALSGDGAMLRGADTPAPLGGGYSSQIRIAVSIPLSLSFGFSA